MINLAIFSRRVVLIIIGSVIFIEIIWLLWSFNYLSKEATTASERTTGFYWTQQGFNENNSRTSEFSDAQKTSALPMAQNSRQYSVSSINITNVDWQNATFCELFKHLSLPSPYPDEPPVTYRYFLRIYDKPPPPRQNPPNCIFVK